MVLSLAITSQLFRGFNTDSGLALGKGQWGHRPRTPAKYKLPLILENRYNSIQIMYISCKLFFYTKYFDKITFVQTIG